MSRSIPIPSASIKTQKESHSESDSKTLYPSTSQKTQKPSPISSSPSHNLSKCYLPQIPPKATPISQAPLSRLLTHTYSSKKSFNSYSSASCLLQA
ncbi:unnamed protein product [Moneuplotes crassus]|uniref:Uncharacterized protein n=1 Tax=Euplotes crassus TaxID=5936 RepID=A0AAD1XLC9_EUPCR|nr:unnamed protein product [Moneuplotes crassus]